MIPYKGISAYARVSVGYAYYQAAALAVDKGFHGFAVQPALGAKLTFFERFHVGIEPFGFDIIHVFPPKDDARAAEHDLGLPALHLRRRAVLSRVSARRCRA